MFDLFLPLVLGVAVGIEPSAQVTDAIEAPVVATDPDGKVALDTGSGDDLGLTRSPEPQIPTGTFTTAVEIRPILTATKNNWVGVREYDGQDLVYFSHLLAWRCGLWDIRYGINDAPADRVVRMEPCHDDMAQPNVMTDIVNFPPYIPFPLSSVDSIYIEIVFDDGTLDSVQLDRDAIRIP